ncbi:hypothetical protein F8388_011115 [Cannabis sativa]|uniref:Kiwellin n=1 Tax=Cannabis sativa TaxID=3483 RepID=A0A7J6E6B5_CANSA|nr:hypothetical protein F8388_011115 [Cannabis sativa]
MYSIITLLIISLLVLLPHHLEAISSCNESCRTLNDCEGQLICTLICKGKSFLKFKCSPPITSSTPAKLTNNDFSEGGDGGAPSQCDERFHSNTERVVALSTGWYNDGSRCGKIIKITAKNGRSTTAKVVDQCDSQNGCDAEHAGQPPCKNNIVDGSNAVWSALGLDTDLGVVDVTWSMASNDDVYALKHYT